MNLYLLLFVLLLVALVAVATAVSFHADYQFADNADDSSSSFLGDRARVAVPLARLVRLNWSPRNWYVRSVRNWYAVRTSVRNWYVRSAPICNEPLAASCVMNQLLLFMVIFYYIIPLSMYVTLEVQNLISNI